jgi:hypothetical protein
VKFSCDIFLQRLIEILKFLIIIFQIIIHDKTIHVHFQIINIFQISRVNLLDICALGHTVDDFRDLHEDFQEITDVVEMFFDKFFLSGHEIVHHSELVVTAIFHIFYLDSFGILCAFSQLILPRDFTSHTSNHPLLQTKEIPPEITLSFISHQPLIPLVQFSNLHFHKLDLNQDLRFCL